MINNMSKTARILWISIPSALVVICLAMMFWLNHEPDHFSPVERATLHAQEHGHRVVTGYTTTSTIIEVVDVMLNKRGGYLSNDVFPPGSWRDNVPNWEFGVLTHVRDTARAFRNELSRSQSQSAEDPDLQNAEGKFFFDSFSASARKADLSEPNKTRGKKRWKPSL